MKAIECFQASDGSIHLTVDAAEQHETFLSQFKIIDNFLSSGANPYKSTAQRAIAKQVIVRWETWKKHHAE